MTNQGLISRVQRFTNEELLETTRRTAEHERQTTVEMLHYLMIIEDRRLFAELAYSSLHEFMVKDLKYSDGAAHRRISAMRLLRDVPAVEEKIKEGTLTITTACQLGDVFRAEKTKNKKSYSSEAKADLVQRMEDLSKREVECELRAISPSAFTDEKTRQVTATEIEIKFLADHEMTENFEKLKALLAHRFPAMTYQDLFRFLAKLGVEKLDPAKPEKSKRSTPSDASSSLKAVTSPGKQSRYIPAPTRRLIWQRDGGQCRFVDEKTGRRCSCRWGLEIDHVVPFACGGSNEPENLRLLCQTHNTLSAIQVFDKQKMNKYLLGG